MDQAVPGVGLDDLGDLFQPTGFQDGMDISTTPAKPPPHPISDRPREPVAGRADGFVAAGSAGSPAQGWGAQGAAPTLQQLMDQTWGRANHA